MPEAEGLIGRRDCRVKLFCHREMRWLDVQQVRSTIDEGHDGYSTMTNSRREHRHAAEGAKSNQPCSSQCLAALSRRGRRGATIPSFCIL